MQNFKKWKERKDELLVENHKKKVEEKHRKQQEERTLKREKEKDNERAFVRWYEIFLSLTFYTPPGWLSGERVVLMTWWLLVLVPLETEFLSDKYLPLTSTEAYEKSSQWLSKEICVSTSVRKPGNTCASPTTVI